MRDKIRILFNYMSGLACEFYDIKPIQLGCEVRGVDLKTENRPEVIERIKQDVTNHSLLVFKDQGIVSGDRHVEISEWFGELESTFYKHPKSPHPDVFRVSNDEEEGCTGVGRTGWHIDGSFQPAPFAYSLYHMVAVPKKGATAFAPLSKIVEGLPQAKREEWDRLWMMSDRRTGPIHPLIYRHPVTKKEVLCFHLGMTSAFLYDYGSSNERLASKEECRRILKDIHEEFVKDGGRIQYIHEWENGDFIISDNLAVGHEATPETQIPRSQVGLRILHRTTVAGTTAPSK
ncbi:Taurine catabolism dioxygenase TauD, TfdA family [Nesidiocoris tenuis]|uniref:Taurine catabolism dioxygenase TauD, TfdA family n=1 Tax=Nesidiocoris tenuis TaxID=355587 RepID=A0ABN7BE26_9HEMI|nr:Taurine catabolism dioxygenase TauD, TfdA family [Nesidiocoris tenuis]